MHFNNIDSQTEYSYGIKSIRKDYSVMDDI